jgi:SAM-dependent methyltransferase
VPGRPVILRAAQLPDFKPAPNQGGHVELYEIENRAFDPDGHVLAAMRARAPWAGRTLLDLGCGSGYWLPGYADEAAEVIGVEPDPRLLPLAAGRDPRARVLQGSAEHIPLADESADVVHARFAYFFPPGCEAGLAEVMRVLRPGGTLVVVGNDLRAGQFAEFVRAAEGALVPAGGPETDAWWAARGADRTTVRSEWRFQNRADLEAVLRMEFPRQVADPWLGAHPGALSLAYSYVLFALDKPAGLLRGGRPGALAKRLAQPQVVAAGVTDGGVTHAVRLVGRLLEDLGPGRAQRLEGLVQVGHLDEDRQIALGDDLAHGLAVSRGNVLVHGGQQQLMGVPGRADGQPAHLRSHHDVVAELEAEPPGVEGERRVQVSAVHGRVRD